MMGRYEENAYWARMMQLAGHKNTRLYEFDGYDHGNMPGPAYPLMLQEIRKKITDWIKRKPPGSIRRLFYVR